jgi:hypothetical protein
MLPFSLRLSNEYDKARLRIKEQGRASQPISAEISQFEHAPRPDVSAQSIGSSEYDFQLYLITEVNLIWAGQILSVKNRYEKYNLFGQA